MTRVIGVSFRTAGKIYFFNPGELEIKKGDHVIVETARGIEYGRVVSAPTDVEDEKVTQPLKPVLRVATHKDEEQEAANKIKEKDAYKLCQEKIFNRGLEMKLIDAEYTFDNSKILFYFTAEGRVDFRELVKDLASVFKTRIELRQIGVRDETKILGGIGICGRQLCCHTYLSDFAPVSIKMAKEQNLSLNPTKISGVCGRLMCCLGNEEETYEELNRNLPKVGDFVTAKDGEKGQVSSVNVLRQTVKVLVEVDDEKELREFPVDDLTFVRRKKGKPAEIAEKDLTEEVEALQDDFVETETMVEVTTEEIVIEEKPQSEKRQQGDNKQQSDRKPKPHYNKNRNRRRNDNNRRNGERGENGRGGDKAPNKD